MATARRGSALPCVKTRYGVAAHLDRRSLRQVARYATLGITTNLAGYLLFLWVTQLGAEPKLAMSILYLVGASASFVGNRSWTFANSGPVFPAAMKFVGTHLCGWALNYAILYALSDCLGYPHQVVQAFAIVIVAGFVFMCFRFIIFDGKAVSGTRTP